MSETIYLDNAATSFPKPREVHDFMTAFYRTSGVNPGRSGCDMALQAEAMISGTRRKLTDFFTPSLVARGGSKNPDRLVFAHNATHALNLVLKGTVAAGDHVVTTAVEHNSVIRPVNHLVAQGAEATFVTCDSEGYVDPDDIRRAIRRDTALVIVNHASNVIGTVQDIVAIGRICAEAGVPFAVDAAQTAGSYPIDMAAAHVSFLAFTGHKGLLGPTGTGGICVADDAAITATMWGGTGVKSAHPFHLDEYPYRLEAGTLNVLGIAGLSAGQDWIAREGLDAIHAREIELLGALQDGFGDIDGVHIHGTRRLDRRVATMSITVDGWDPSDVGTLLDVDFNVLTRTGLQCAPLIHERMATAPRGTVRFSIGPFNTRADVEQAVHGVASIAAMRRA